MISVYLSPLSIHSTSGSGVKADLCDRYDCSVQILGIFRSAVCRSPHLITSGDFKQDNHNVHLCSIKQQILYIQSWFYGHELCYTVYFFTT